jgi:NO-binding membrane sensor protein with MHYT domain
MFQLLTCLQIEHDWRLVALAGAVCLLASVVTISLFHRAKASGGQARIAWLCLDAAAGGCGIWATHFIAMLAFDPGAAASYDLRLTILSLGFAMGITGAGFATGLLWFLGERRSSLAPSLAVVSARCTTRVCSLCSFQGISRGRYGSLQCP